MMYPDENKDISNVMQGFVREAAKNPSSQKNKVLKPRNTASEKERARKPEIDTNTVVIIYDQGRIISYPSNGELKRPILPYHLRAKADKIMTKRDAYDEWMLQEKMIRAARSRITQDSIKREKLKRHLDQVNCCRRNHCKVPRYDIEKYQNLPKKLQEKLKLYKRESDSEIKRRIFNAGERKSELERKRSAKLQVFNENRKQCQRFKAMSMRYGVVWDTNGQGPPLTASGETLRDAKTNVKYSRVGSELPQGLKVRLKSYEEQYNIGSSSDKMTAAALRRLTNINLRKKRAGAYSRKVLRRGQITMEKRKNKGIDKCTVKGVDQHDSKAHYSEDERLEVEK